MDADALVLTRALDATSHTQTLFDRIWGMNVKTNCKIKMIDVSIDLISVQSSPITYIHRVLYPLWMTTDMFDTHNHQIKGLQGRKAVHPGLSHFHQFYDIQYILEQWEQHDVPVIIFMEHPFLCALSYLIDVVRITLDSSQHVPIEIWDGCDQMPFCIRLSSRYDCKTPIFVSTGKPGQNAVRICVAPLVINKRFVANQLGV